ncbi:MAG: hypothetical protein IT204_13905 [Fimbriimonadaceae bacterium]|nr:hypothetical protein [Fimbriimonadaceae bacterium]
MGAEATLEGVQCPKCRAVSYPGLMGFPRCHRCHEQLRQCRYCTHQARGLCRLAATPRPRLLAAEGKPYCEGFESSLRRGPVGSRFAQPLSGNARIVGLTAATVLLLTWLLWSTLGVERGLRLELDEPRVWVQDGRARVGMTIAGDPALLGTMELRLAGPALQHYTIEDPLPLAESIGLVARLRLDAQGTQRLQVTLVQRPGAPGACPLTVNLVGTQAELLATAQTMLRAPARP